jgi:DNA-binding beta-propeller fold protein YncE
MNRHLIACALAALASAPASAQVPGLGGTLIVTNKQPATATIVDVATGRTLATLPTGNGPHEIALSSDGRVAVVTDYGAQQPGRTLTVIEMPAMRVARTIDIAPYTRPHGIAFLPGDSLVAVSSESSRNVVVVNVRTGDVSRAIGTNAPGSHMVATTANGAFAYTGDMGSHTVTELDLRTNKATRTWTVPNVPEAINVTADGKEVWVGSNATGKVSVIDVATGTVTTAAEGVQWPYRVLFTPDLKTVVIPDLRGEEVRFLERVTRKELSRIPLAGAGPQGLTISPNGRWVFLSLSAQGRVAIIDMNTRTVAGHLNVGPTPDGVVYLPATSPAAPRVPMGASGTVKPEDVKSIDGIMTALYDVISGPAGQKRDWDRFRGLFAPSARLIPTGRRPNGQQVFRMLTPEEYVTTIGPQLEQGGFFEREIGRRTDSFGSVTHVFSAYDSKRALADAAPFSRGINSIQVFHDGDRYWVLSIFWDSERTDLPIPSQYLGKP